jgi:translation initiation factor IF-3
MSSFIFPKFLEVICINMQKKDEAIVNEAIRAKEMLVITDTGEKLGVIARAKALN